MQLYNKAMQSFGIYKIERKTRDASMAFIHRHHHSTAILVVDDSDGL